MVTRLFILLTALAALPAPAAPNRTPPLVWVFQMRRDAQTDPHTDVFLRVDRRQISVLRRAPDEFRPLAKADYKTSGIPAAALTACAGWWAGAGDDLYVVRRGHALVVYRKELDEQTPDLPWKRLKIIPLR